MAPPKHAAVAPVEEDGFRRASMDRFHVGAGICGRRRIWGAKVLRRWPQWHAAPWARSQSQTKQQPPPAGERQVHDRAVALVKGLQRSPAMVEGLDHPVEAAEEESPVAPREDDRGQVLDREVVQAADRAGVRFTRSTLLWLVSTTYSRPPLASSECGTPSGSQSRSGPHKGSFATGLGADEGADVGDVAVRAVAPDAHDAGRVVGQTARAAAALDPRTSFGRSRRCPTGRTRRRARRASWAGGRRPSHASRPAGIREMRPLKPARYGPSCVNMLSTGGHVVAGWSPPIPASAT